MPDTVSTDTRYVQGGDATPVHVTNAGAIGGGGGGGLAETVAVHGVDAQGNAATVEPVQVAGVSYTDGNVYALSVDSTGALSVRGISGTTGLDEPTIEAIQLNRATEDTLLAVVAALSTPPQVEVVWTKSNETTTQTFDLIAALTGVGADIRDYNQVIAFVQLTNAGAPLTFRWQGAPIGDNSANAWQPLNTVPSNITGPTYATYGYGLRSTSNMGLTQAVGGFLPTTNFRAQMTHTTTVSSSYTVRFLFAKG